MFAPYCMPEVGGDPIHFTETPRILCVGTLPSLEKASRIRHRERLARLQTLIQKFWRAAVLTNCQMPIVLTVAAPVQTFYKVEMLFSEAVENKKKEGAAVFAASRLELPLTEQTARSIRDVIRQHHAVVLLGASTTQVLAVNALRKLDDIPAYQGFTGKARLPTHYAGESDSLDVIEGDDPFAAYAVPGDNPTTGVSQL